MSLIAFSTVGCGGSSDSGFHGSGIATGGTGAADASTSLSGTGGDATMSSGGISSSGGTNTGATNGSGANTSAGGMTSSDGSAAMDGSPNGNADSGEDGSTVPTDGSGASGDGGATPGVISCAGTPCTIAGTPTNTCCIGAGLYPTICSPSFPGCAVVAGYPIDCDDRSDCANGDVCCESTAALTAGAHCAADCGTNMYQLCRTDSECKNGTTCQTFQQLPEYNACQ